MSWSHVVHQTLELYIYIYIYTLRSVTGRMVDRAKCDWTKCPLDETVAWQTARTNRRRTNRPSTKNEVVVGHVVWHTSGSDNRVRRIILKYSEIGWTFLLISFNPHHHQFSIVNQKTFNNTSNVSREASYTKVSLQKHQTAPLSTKTRANSKIQGSELPFISSLRHWPGSVSQNRSFGKACRSLASFSAP